MDRLELAAKIIDARSRVSQFRMIDQIIFKSILNYPEFQEFNNDLKKKASCIVLGYIPKCRVCGSNVGFNTFRANNPESSWARTCSVKCSYNDLIKIEKMKITNLDRYGHENPLNSKQSIEQRKKNNLEKYGCEYTLQLKEIQDKIKATNLERYGFENPAKSKEIQDKIKATNLERYGFENPLSAKSIRDEIKKTNLERYGVEHNWSSSELREKAKSTNLERYGNEYALGSNKIIAKRRITLLTNKYSSSNINQDFLNLLFENNNDSLRYFLEELIIKNDILTRRQLSNLLSYGYQSLVIIIRELGLDHYFTNQLVSNSEQEVFEFVKSLNVNTEQSDRTILEGKELDIYIPEKNLAIEFDGIYWHSINSGKDKNYHLEKTNLAESKGIQLLHIFEPEWDDPIKQEIWKSIIKAKLGIFDSVIYARKCSMKEITSKEARDFLDRNHLQGFANGKTHLGLVYNGILVSVISYGSSRFKKNETEIIRFASLLNTRVQGGFSKLLKQIKSENLVSFADRRYSSNLNNVYSKTMVLDSISSPSFWVHEDGVLKHRLGYQKHLLKEKLETFEPNKTAMDNLLDNDKLVIYDCGNLKYKYHKSHLNYKE